jgi:ATP-binding cassette subfamily F protein uup
MDKIVDHLFIFRGQGVIENFQETTSDFRFTDSAMLKKERTKQRKDWKQIIQLEI